MRGFIEKLGNFLYGTPKLKYDREVENFAELKNTINNIDTFDHTRILFRTPSCKGYYKAYVHKAGFANKEGDIVVIDLIEE